MDGWISESIPIQTVYIKLSRDGGITWHKLKYDVSNSGSYQWKVKGQATNQVIVRVEILYGIIFYSDDSDGSFTIVD